MRHEVDSGTLQRRLHQVKEVFLNGADTYGNNRQPCVSGGDIRDSKHEGKIASFAMISQDCSPRSSTSEHLPYLELSEHYTVLEKLGSGTYGKVLLAECQETGTKVALKILPKASTKVRDFIREFNYSYYLSPHRSIINTFDVAFETDDAYAFAQEHAPMGDAFEAITPQVGMPESKAKSLIKQVASALEFIHSKNLVHRDIKPENVLLFDTDCQKVKLMDFGMTRKVGTMVRKTGGSIPYTPPEVCEAVKNERYTVETNMDVWACGVLLFCALTGNFPWENAHRKDVYFNEFVLWQKRKTTRIPSQWKRFTPRLMRLFRKILEPKPDKRCSIKEVLKYINDSWLQYDDKNEDDVDDESDNGRHMDELSTMLKKHGIETKVTRRFRERRVSEWLLST